MLLVTLEADSNFLQFGREKFHQISSDSFSTATFSTSRLSPTYIQAMSSAKASSSKSPVISLHVLQLVNSTVLLDCTGQLNTFHGTLPQLLSNLQQTAQQKGCYPSTERHIPSLFRLLRGWKQNEAGFSGLSTASHTKKTSCPLCESWITRSSGLPRTGNACSDSHFIFAILSYF